MRSLVLIGKPHRTGKKPRSEDAGLLAKLRRLFEDERKAHATGDDELAAKLAKKQRELNKKRRDRK